MGLSEEMKTGEGESRELDDESLSGEHSSQETDDLLSLGIAEPENEEEVGELPPELPRFRSLLPLRGDSNQSIDSAMRRLPDAFTPTRPKYDAKL